ncbi:MAG: ABC transporter permease subunit [bacterium]|nr:ABC transporter permease subunit [bacterium]
MQFWALVVDSFRESRDRKIFWVLIGLSLLIAAVRACIGFSGNKVSFLFGLVESETDWFNPLTAAGRAHVATILVYGLMDFFLGWIGVALMVIATAGVFPAMMQGGAIDVLLAKPMSRPRLFVYKYIASMVFVLVQATFFVVLTYLVAGVRWGVWVPGYLLSIPLLVLLFSYIYCVTVLVAVTTRSTVAAILLTIGAWVVFSLVRGAPGVFDTFPGLQKYETTHRVIEAVAWIPPKTADIPYLAAKWTGAGTSLDMFPASLTENDPNVDTEQFERARPVEEEQLEMSATASIGSSLVFEALLVLVAMWRFSRRDF